MMSANNKQILQEFCIFMEIAYMDDAVDEAFPSHTGLP